MKMVHSAPISYSQIHCYITKFTTKNNPIQYIQATATTTTLNFVTPLFHHLYSTTFPSPFSINVSTEKWLLVSTHQTFLFRLKWVNLLFMNYNWPYLLLCLLYLLPSLSYIFSTSSISLTSSFLFSLFFPYFSLTFFFPFSISFLIFPLCFQDSNEVR